MNKEKIGRFLKDLRDENDLKQKQLGEKIGLTDKNISDWENGKALPDIDALQELSKVFNVSIDEILQGSRHQKTKFEEKYKNNSLLVNSEFKKLLNKKIDEELDLNEEDEFEYLFNNYFELRKYSSKFVKSKNDSDYLKFKESFYKILGKFKDLDKEEKLFEIHKLYKTKEEVMINYKLLINTFEKGDNIKKSFNLLEPWEKDMYFMLLQKYDLFITDDRDDIYAQYYENYENRFGKIHTKEEKLKSAISFMINNGACYNELFLNKIKRYKEKGRIIDVLEEHYKMCKKPLKFNVCENGKYKSYLIENTRKNRFLLGIYHNRSTYSLNIIEYVLSFDELYDFLWKYNPNSLTEKEEKEVKALLGINSLEDAYSYKQFLEEWKKYRNEEIKIENSLKELKQCEKLLNEGIIENEYDKEIYIGGSDFKSMMDWFYSFKDNVSYKDFENSRNKQKSKELLDNLNNLSLDEINEYFKEKIIEGE